MASGRCAGCHATGSLRKINQHVTTCDKYLLLYQQDPRRCLAPAAEYERHRTQDTTPEARAHRRDTRLNIRFADLNRQQAISTSRWATPPDLLE